VEPVLAETLVCRGAAASAADLLEGAAAVLWLRRAEAPGTLRAAASAPRTLLSSGSVGGGLSGSAVAAGAPAGGPLTPEDPELRPLGPGTAAAVPVRSDGRVVGALVLVDRSGDAGRSVDLDALQRLADGTGEALAGLRGNPAGLASRRDERLQLAMAGHELKTPLTVVLGALQTLRAHDADMPADLRRDVVASALRRALDLDRLVHAFLEGSRADLASETQELSLAELLARAADGFGAAGVDLDVVPPASASLQVRVDVDAVVAVTGVLLENALRHGTDGAVRISAAGEPRGDGTVDVVLRVSNCGRLPDGVDPSLLFAPFRRSPSAAGHGVGLGLAIAARLADALGGSISAAQETEQVVLTLRFRAGAGEAGRDPGRRGYRGGRCPS
jgi:signal transduction histidine kinase